MIVRRALLVGAAKYGTGFSDLDAVEQDLEVMQHALEARGFEVSIVDEDSASSGSELDRALREFVSELGRNDFGLIYFSGHGISLDGIDYVIPGTVSRDEALVPNHRVSTDLSKAVESSDARMVLFAIDACRDDPLVKGATGSWSFARNDNERRFIRLYGCSKGQVCHVLPKAQDAKNVSLFTKALAGMLEQPETELSLKGLLNGLEARCAELAKEHGRGAQQPWLDLDELSASAIDLLNTNLPFEVLGPVELTWSPEHLGIAVVTSERAHKEDDPDGLARVVRNALQTGAARIWSAFRHSISGQTLLDGTVREIAAEFQHDRVQVYDFNILDALGSTAQLEAKVRSIIRADLAVFDVTDFEPAIMTLMGVRAAVRRGVTISSHGGGWYEGQPIELPFNMQDLQIASHTPPPTDAGPDPVVSRLVDRVEAGFVQRAKHPSYRDLPAYDDLRRLGATPDAWGTIPYQEEVLLLCSYSNDYRPNLNALRDRLNAQLQRRCPKPNIKRVIDLGSPQVVSQTLHERIRRMSACVVDWTEFSGSVFFELGVRLAVSPWGAVQLVDKQRSACDLEQIGLMTNLFEPLKYDVKSRDVQVFEEAISRIVNASLDEADEDRNPVRRAVRSALKTVEPCTAPLHEQLRATADGLHDPQSGKSRMQLLFPETKNDRETAALEHRIAACLYLEHRKKVLERAADDPLRQSYVELAAAAAAGLYDRGEAGDLELALDFEEKAGG